MKRTLSKELINNVGKKVLVKGWVVAIRLLGKVNFLVIRDRLGDIQIVIQDKAELNKVKDLQPGSVLEIEATVNETNQTDLGIELNEPKISVVSAVTESWPIEVYKDGVKANMDTILDYRPLTLRNKKYKAIFKIQATLVQAYREFLISEGFTEFFPPNIIGASSEGGSELFQVNYFDDKAMLSQSAQLYKQVMVGVYERVFGLAKCFRAEKSNTRRHLTEATQFEFEMGFIESFDDVMDMLERVIKHMTKTVKEKNVEEIKDLGLEIVDAPEDVKFPRVAFKDALQIYFERTGIDERNEIDLSPAAEKELCKYAKEKFGTDFIFIPYFPTEKVAFYAKPNADNPKVANYFDLLCREAEIVSGGERINNHDQLVESLKKKELDPKDFVDYLSIFKYGMPRHGGFGMGMERFTMLALGLDNIRNACIFPSDPKRIASVPLATKLYLGKDLGVEIIKRLESAGVEYKEMHHEETPTSEDSARVRGTKISEGVKAIILKGKKSKKNIMVNVPGDQRVDLKKIKELEGEHFEFEKPDVIKERYGLELGSIPPFGNLLGLKTYFDSSVLNEERSAFNRGSLTDSVVMKSKDLVEMTGGIIIN